MDRLPVPHSARDPDHGQVCGPQSAEQGRGGGGMGEGKGWRVMVGGGRAGTGRRGWWAGLVGISLP